MSTGFTIYFVLTGTGVLLVLGHFASAHFQRWLLERQVRRALKS